MITQSKAHLRSQLNHDDPAQLETQAQQLSLFKMERTLEKIKPHIHDKTFNLESKIMKIFLQSRINHWTTFLESWCIVELNKTKNYFDDNFLIYFKKTKTHDTLGELYSIKIKPKNKRYCNKIIKSITKRWKKLLDFYPEMSHVDGTGLICKSADDKGVLYWYQIVLSDAFPTSHFKFEINDNTIKSKFKIYHSQKYVLFLSRKVPRTESKEFKNSKEFNEFNEFKEFNDSIEFNF